MDKASEVEILRFDLGRNKPLKRYQLSTGTISGNVKAAKHRTEHVSLHELRFINFWGFDGMSTIKTTRPLYSFEQPKKMV